MSRSCSAAAVESERSRCALGGCGRPTNLLSVRVLNRRIIPAQRTQHARHATQHSNATAAAPLIESICTPAHSIGPWLRCIRGHSSERGCAWHGNRSSGPRGALQVTGPRRCMAVARARRSRFAAARRIAVQIAAADRVTGEVAAPSPCCWRARERVCMRAAVLRARACGLCH